MYSTIHSDGSSAVDPPLASLPDLLGELSTADREHGDVAVVHEQSGWSLSAHRDGRLVLEHLSEGGERHMKPVSKERILELWHLLIRGEPDAVLAEPWQAGYLAKQ